MVCLQLDSTSGLVCFHTPGNNGRCPVAAMLQCAKALACSRENLHRNKTASKEAAWPKEAQKPVLDKAKQGGITGRNPLYHFQEIQRSTLTEWYWHMDLPGTQGRSFTISERWYIE